MLLKLDKQNTDYAIPFNYIKVLKADYGIDNNSLLITYECGNLDDSGAFQRSKDSEQIHCEPETINEYFGKVSPEADAYAILMARAGYEGVLI